MSMDAEEINKSLKKAMETPAAALADHAYESGQDTQDQQDQHDQEGTTTVQVQHEHILLPRPRPKEEHFKWTDDETRTFLELRRKYIDRFFCGKRGNIQKTYAIILDEMGLTGKVTPSQARKKWNNMCQLYRRLVNQPQFDAVDGKAFVPLVTWPFFKDVAKTIEVEPPQMASECPQFEGASLEDLSEQINARIIQVAFPSGDGTTENGGPPAKRRKRKKRELLEMVEELSELTRKQEEIMIAKNKLTIRLLSQMV